MVRIVSMSDDGVETEDVSLLEHSGDRRRGICAFLCSRALLFPLSGVLVCLLLAALCVLLLLRGHSHVVYVTTNRSTEIAQHVFTAVKRPGVSAPQYGRGFMTDEDARREFRFVDSAGRFEEIWAPAAAPTLRCPAVEGTECAGRGFCDHLTGRCRCLEGFSGIGCAMAVGLPTMPPSLVYLPDLPAAPMYPAQLCSMDQPIDAQQCRVGAECAHAQQYCGAASCEEVGAASPEGERVLGVWDAIMTGEAVPTGAPTPAGTDSTACAGGSSGARCCGGHWRSGDTCCSVSDSRYALAVCAPSQQADTLTCSADDACNFEDQYCVPGALGAPRDGARCCGGVWLVGRQCCEERALPQSPSAGAAGSLAGICMHGRIPNGCGFGNSGVDGASLAACMAACVSRPELCQVPDSVALQHGVLRCNIALCGATWRCVATWYALRCNMLHFPPR